MRASVALQYVLPHRFLSRLVLWGTRWTFAPWKDFLIRRIVKAYRVDLGEAEQPDPAAYAHFNAFFTRALKPGARPQAEAADAVLCPADGRISQAGPIRAGRVFQAKGQDFSVAELLGDEAAAAPYADGRFATVYLSPRDYHRVHMPLAGELLETVHVPGRLFSVASFAVAAVPRLFARNERLVCHFRGANGPFAVVLVGAMLVSGIETVWGGVEVPPYASRITRRDWRSRGVRLARGVEMGRFNMGSTAIVLLPAAATLDPALSPEQAVRVGEPIGSLAGANLLPGMG
ncbi:archaetidylserine decarboxylase [Dokdonella fugitiva]|jgi:phosphatidylserine decarboxylase|uniref:Phosphatidylserine decarboxylase proenzyme n=1 Tax=Dokdonella fugitiva TaxID=328517 RepID=A0A4R2I3M0_9GAMM|nr:archaetidylserine decarboxylase [Dokdonella fugitiva]MBA8885502.1 phosphatidylserine decarboxylase [Dokdonella fugitiva]TCO38326.1 phosphatidylserine decarboxylase [Dokdonella fugitiva]